MKETELKPCSCGCEAELVESQAFSWCDVTYYVRCTNPDCDERTELKYEHKIDAINAWNKKQEFLLPLIEKKSGDCKNCNSHEKQIDEMAKILCGMKNGCDGCMWDKAHCNERNYAEEIYNAGYRKQSEVIHCRDCGVPHNKWTGCPKLNGLVTHPDFYCAYAEPKMKGENDE